MRRKPLDPRDARDLEVLAQRQHGARVKEIARVTGAAEEIVETILAADAQEFPDEPLRSGAA